MLTIGEIKFKSSTIEVIIDQELRAKKLDGKAITLTNLEAEDSRTLALTSSTTTSTTLPSNLSEASIIKASITLSSFVGNTQAKETGAQGCGGLGLLWRPVNCPRVRINY